MQHDGKEFDCKEKYRLVNYFNSTIRCSNSDSGNIGHIEKLDSALSSIIDENVKIEIGGKDFDWREGPLWLEESKTLIFSDVPRNIIYSWSEEAGLNTYLTPSGYTGSVSRAGEKGYNGLALSRDNKLLICQHGDRRFVAMHESLADPHPNYVSLADNFGGKKFNSPNITACGFTYHGPKGTIGFAPKKRKTTGVLRGVEVWQAEVTATETGKNRKSKVDFSHSG